MVVRMRATRSHRDNRRAHHALKAMRFSVCSNCKKTHLAHQVCLYCGMYKGVKVLDFDKKIAKITKKTKAKENAAK